MEEVQKLFLDALGEPKEGFSGSYFNNDLNWELGREEYEVSYDRSGNSAFEIGYSINETENNQ